MVRSTLSALTMLMFMTASSLALSKDIIHDAEFAILKAKNGQQWEKHDKEIDKRLAALREKNDGKAPNIVYILIDDLGFGELGSRELSVVRGYDTPNIASIAKNGLSLQRMYTEPSCTPTRVAMMTGRHPVRTGTMEAKTTLAGDGLNAEEVTIAEVLRENGYNTSHVGKWHLGDIEQSFPHRQGFMHAEFPIHQQAQLGIMNIDAEMAGVVSGVDPSQSSQKFTLDDRFVPNPSHMVMGVEQKGNKLVEVGIEKGTRWTQAMYQEMNQRYQDNTIKQLRKLAKEDKPFFLNYWPLIPSTYTRTEYSEFRTLNGGVWAESIVRLDDWIGEITREIDKLGIAENTILVVMGDNGPFMAFAGLSGSTERVYRGGKGDHLEGGVRVNAFVQWKGVIEAGSYAEDIIHVTDLFTTFARIGQASDDIPRDRVIDGLDQTGMWMLGETHGRRDYVYIYEGPSLKSIVKNKFKMHLPPPGANPIRAAVFDLYRDSREERPEDSYDYAPWAGGPFAAMAKRHMMFREQYPDREPGKGVPYSGISNLRPETESIVDSFLLLQGKK